MAYPKKKFAKLYDEYVEKIYRFVFLKVSSQEEAQDLTSQVFTKGWKKFRKGDKIDNPPAYLYQIARAEIANHHREKARFQTVQASADQIIDPNPGLEEKSKLDSDMATVKNCLTKLNNDYQNVLVWKYIDGYSNKEIAEMSGKSEGAVRVMLHRALKVLRATINNK